MNHCKQENRKKKASVQIQNCSRLWSVPSFLKHIIFFFNLHNISFFQHYVMTFFKYSFFCSIDNYNMYKEAKTLVAPRPPEKPEKFMLVSRDMTCSFRKLQGKAVLLLCAIYSFFAACMPHRWLGWNVCVVCCWPHRLNWRGWGGDVVLGFSYWQFVCTKAL